MFIQPSQLNGECVDSDSVYAFEPSASGMSASIILILKCSVGTETGCSLDGRSSIPSKGNISLFSTESGQALEPPSFL